MAEHGGPRTPAHPAPVSGPGRLSRRTDGGITHQQISAVGDQAYGEAKAQKDAQRIAPMAGADPMAKPAVAPPGAGGGGMPAYAGGDFAGPSQRPGEPITAGVDIGAGPGPEAMSFQPIQPGGPYTG